MTANSRIKNWLWIGFLLSPFVLMASCGAYVYDLKRRTASADLLVDQLCEKDAGIYIYERVEAPSSYFKVLGELPQTPHETTPPDLSRPYVLRQGALQYFVKGNPAVVRTEVLIVRQSDQKILSRQVGYSRHGGEPVLFQSYSPIASQHHCKRFVGSGSDLKSATYVNSPPFFPPFRLSANKPRIFQ